MFKITNHTLNMACLDSPGCLEHKCRWSFTCENVLAEGKKNVHVKDFQDRKPSPLQNKSE